MTKTAFVDFNRAVRNRGPGEYFIAWLDEVAGLQPGDRFLATDHELEAEAEVVEIGPKNVIIRVISSFWEVGHADIPLTPVAARFSPPTPPAMLITSGGRLIIGVGASATTTYWTISGTPRPWSYSVGSAGLVDA